MNEDVELKSDDKNRGVTTATFKEPSAKILLFGIR